MEFTAEENKKRIALLLKVLLVQVVVTVIVLFVLAFAMLKTDASVNILQIAVIAIYVIANFLGGFIIGKTVGKQKFVWGLIVGCVYFVALSIASFVIHKGFYQDVGYAMTVLGICLGSGMLGGMLS